MIMVGREGVRKKGKRRLREDEKKREEKRSER